VKNIQLLLCPFCGSTTTIRDFMANGIIHKKIWCSNMECPCNDNSYTVEQWNTRGPVLSEEQVKQLQSVDAALEAVEWDIPLCSRESFRAAFPDIFGAAPKS
jgi:C4-type Zn-finger protein